MQNCLGSCGTCHVSQSKAIFSHTKRWLFGTSELQVLFICFEKAKESWLPARCGFKHALATGERPKHCESLLSFFTSEEKEQDVFCLLKPTWKSGVAVPALNEVKFPNIQPMMRTGNVISFGIISICATCNIFDIKLIWLSTAQLWRRISHSLFGGKLRPQKLYAHMQSPLL